MIGFAFPFSYLLTLWLNPSQLRYVPAGYFQYPLLELTVIHSATVGFSIVWILSLLHSSTTLLLAQRLSSVRVASILALPVIPLTLWYGADLMGRVPGVYTTVPEMIAGSSVFILFAWVAGGHPDQGRGSVIDRLLTLTATAMFGFLALAFFAMGGSL